MTKKVLIIEDEDSLRTVMKDMLREKKYQVLQADNGQMGLEVALEQRPDAILLDLHMPKMDGQEVLRQIRQDPWGRTATVIIMTNQGDQENIDTAHSEGITKYIVKSDWSIDELIKEVQKTLFSAT